MVKVVGLMLILLMGCTLQVFGKPQMMALVLALMLTYLMVNMVLITCQPQAIQPQMF